MSDRPAILGGEPVRAGKSWPTWPQWDGSEQRRLQEVLESGAWSSAHGDQVERLAAEFAEFQGARYAIAVTNGTQALEAALTACGIGAGDEVIVPALTFVATATSVMTVNATPLLVDIDRESFCIDPAAVREAVTDRTRAIIAVHLGGRACDLDELSAICAERDLVLIEDCAQCQGTSWRGKGTGTVGKAGAFSFQQTKLMTAGEGGMVTTDDELVVDSAWSFANLGRTRGGAWYAHAVRGTNMRMTEWQGAVLRSQLERLPEQQRTREERGEILDAELANLPGLSPQSGDSRMDRRARYSYGVLYDPEAFSGLSTQGLEAALNREGIPMSFRYPSLNELELFRDGVAAPGGSGAVKRYPPGSLPNSEEAAANIVWFDHRVLLGEPEDALDVARALRRIQENAGAVKLRTSRSAQAAGRLVKSALRRSG